LRPKRQGENLELAEVAAQARMDGDIDPEETEAVLAAF